MMRRALVIGCLLLVGGCADKGHKATVSLEIAGADHSFVTTRAEVDRQVEGGPYSVYLLRDEGQEGEAYLGLRRFSGNPVAHLWLRVPKPGSSDLERYECYVPGTLADGRATLGWAKADGTARNRQETGDADCTAVVAEAEGALAITFDAAMRLRDGGEAGEPLRVRGSATLQLR